MFVTLRTTKNREQYVLHNTNYQLIMTMYKSHLKSVILTAAIAMITPTIASADNNTDFNRWLEADSAQAIKSRLLADFNLTFDEAVAELTRVYGADIASHAREFADKHYIETKVIDGVERVHRKSIRNLRLLNPQLSGWDGRGESADTTRHEYASEVIAKSAASGKVDKNSHSRHVHYRFTIDVPYNDALKGDTLRVWMPVPFESMRQSDIKILSVSHPAYILSGLDRSVHNSLFIEQPVVEGKDSHFEYEAEYTAYGQYYSPEYILANIKPYDTESQLYKQYTAVELPHIIHLDLAREIVGDETNPYRQSELVYDYITSHYPWAGAREYSTIECLPQYVLDEGHGDCGQVSLLYISMMRSLGVPARWESGWMLHPGEKNLHDWAEVYYEGIGWVPVDVSFGRYSGSDDKRVVNFYSTGMDIHRLAANQGVCGKFFPPKRFVRSETVDFQLGEVETTRGNLFYPAWNQHLEIIE